VRPADEDPVVPNQPRPERVRESRRRRVDPERAGFFLFGFIGDDPPRSIDGGLSACRGGQDGKTLEVGSGSRKLRPTTVGHRAEHENGEGGKHASTALREYVCPF
jgi:hypothetical protein